MRKGTLHRLIRKNLFMMSALPIIILGIYIFNSQSFLYQSTLESHIQDRFELYVSHMDVVDKATRDVLVALRTTRTEEELKSRMDAYSHLFSEGTFIMAAFEDGRCLGNKVWNLPKDFDARNRPWYKDAVESAGNIIVTDPYENVLDNGVLCMTYAVSLSDYEGSKAIGVAGVDIDLEKLLPFSQEGDFPVGTYFALSDRTGRVLVDTMNPLQDSQKLILEKVSSLTATGTQKSYIKLNGKGYDIHVRSYDKTGWIMMALVPRTELLKRQFEIVAITSIVMVILILLALHSAKRVHGQVIEPIDRLAAHMEEMDLDGELESLETQDAYPAEVEILNTSMNNMIDRISEQRNAILENQMEISRQYMEIEALYEETTAMNENLNDMVGHLNTSFTETIRALSNAIEASDQYTRGHCERVTELAVALADSIGLDGSRIRQLELASHLHDIGKVGIPTHILNKTERLSDEEFQLIKYHPEIGCNIIEGVSFLKEASPIIKHHHERFDGNGYPDGIKGEAISVEARILSIADSYDAMTSSRSYRKIPLTHEAAINELRLHSGSQFDGHLVEAFIKMMGNESVTVNGVDIS